jgi:hypothetical protein
MSCTPFPPISAALRRWHVQPRARGRWSCAGPECHSSRMVVHPKTETSTTTFA